MTVTDADVTIKRLVFESLSRGTHGLSTGVGDFLVDGKITEMMKGASALELEVLDRDYAGLGSGLFGTRVVATIDAVDFRLTSVSCVAEERLRALMEHRLISEMREHSRPLKATRGHVTRAEFILMMLRELHLPYVFICPELHRTQKTAKPEISEVPSEAEPPTPGSEETPGEELPSGPTPTAARSLSATGLTVKHVGVKPEQLHVLNTALNKAMERSAPELAEVALVVALIQENSATNPDPGNPGDRGALSLIDSTIHGIQKTTGTGTINPFDIAEVVDHFLTAGFYGKGGAIALARAHPDWSAGQIAQACQGSAYPTAYGQWDGEAKAIVRAFNKSETMSGAGTPTAAAAATTKTATYEFSRGKPEQREDTFTCAQRLADEVGWHFFVAGPRTIYFVNDDDLLKMPPKFTITPDSPGLVGPPLFDVEVGGRTVISKGRRIPKPSEAELKARLNRWSIPPGTVLELKGWGPADGKWIAGSRERGLFDAAATIHLLAPAKPLEEPRATTSTELNAPGSGAQPKGVPSNIPAPQSGQYRENISAQGPIGTTTFQGITVAKWTVPMLRYAQKHGWSGHITSGYRPGADPHTTSGGSEHAGTQYPHGAIDFGGPADFAARAAFFACCGGFTGLPLIPAQFGPYGAYPTGDGGHASGTGH